MVIVMGAVLGGLRAAADIKEVRAWVPAACAPLPRKPCPVLPSRHGRWSSMLGSAAFVSSQSWTRPVGGCSMGSEVGGWRRLAVGSAVLVPCCSQSMPHGLLLAMPHPLVWCRPHPELGQELP